ncbi:NAD(P)-binding oxidoreductase [Oceanobacillus sp. HCA-5259]|uniref:NAD(P)-dependent oxidoreductase n=1 Tax=Oceanobacillus sp. HCA-5259 TaxID=3134661 RepID=UPI0030C3D612
MKILVIGATGRTGEELLKQTLEQGYEAVAYVRRPDAVPIRENLQVIGGQLDDTKKLTKALKGIDAVLMALGNSIANRNEKLFEFAIPSVIEAMKEAGVKRLISLSGLGVGDTFENTRYPYRFGIRSFLKGNFADHVAGEKQLENSGLNWTTIHPGPLFNGGKTKNPIVKDAASGYKMPRAPRTNRADVAHVMLSIIEDDTTFEKQLVMSSVQNSN